MGQVREEKRKHAEKRKRRGIREDEKEREREGGLRVPGKPMILKEGREDAH